MASWTTVYRKELRSYFTSPIPYVFLVIFLIFASAWFFHVNDFFSIGAASLEAGFFGIVGWMLVFLVPPLTMRLWSEERDHGTVEVLMTMPISTRSLVLGKFFAAWTLLFVAFFLTLPIPITVASVGPLDWGPVITGYLGALLMGGALIALGQWISALSPFQIVAFFITLIVAVALQFMAILSGEITGGLGSLFQTLAPASHYQSLGRGVIDMRDILYFLSFGVFFLYLNSQQVENWRYR